MGRRLVAWLGLAGLALWALPAPAQTVSREYDLKAAFVYNFATFVEWPAGAFTRPDTPFVIAVIGENPFGPALEELTRGERVKGHPIVIRRIQTAEGAAGCQLVFISTSVRRDLKEILEYFHHEPVLTVSDIAGFLEAGGMIRLGVDAHINVQINLTAVRAGGLTVSPKLLRLAQVVNLPLAPP